jgi:hypothetical protein
MCRAKEEGNTGCPRVGGWRTDIRLYKVKEGIIIWRCREAVNEIGILMNNLFLKSKE